MAVPKSIHKLNFKITPDINDWTPPEQSLQNFHFSLLGIRQPRPSKKRCG